LETLATLQRREEFLDLLKGTVAKNLKGEFNAKTAVYVINLTTYSDLMVITDINTPWNSTYLSILRGLKLKAKFQYYSINNRNELNADYLEKADWKIL
jgi:hypothetical protein